MVFNYRQFKRGQGTHDRFRPPPPGWGQGTAELNEMVQ
jgi:hypothetical protein